MCQFPTQGQGGSTQEMRTSTSPSTFSEYLDPKQPIKSVLTENCPLKLGIALDNTGWLQLLGVMGIKM